MNRAWLVAAILLAWASPAFGAQEVVIGSKKFTEAVVLAEVARLTLEQAGLRARHREQLGGTRVLWSALERGDIDLYVDYTGTLAQEILGGEVDARDHAALRRALAARGVTMSKPLGFNNTYALGMRKRRAQELGLRAISDLAATPGIVWGLSNEFLDRKDGWPGLKKAYGLGHRDIKGFDHDLAYKGLASGAIDIVDCYSTDAEIAYYDLLILDDDRGYFPEYAAVLLGRKLSPAAQKALSALEGRITAKDMIAMNRSVKLDRVSESKAAADFVARALEVRISAEPERGMTERLAQRSAEHLAMVAVSLLAAIALAIPAGVLAFRRPRLGQLILSVTGLLQTIPSLALLVFMIPVLGIGTTPAVVALFLYSLLPIVRSTHAGLSEIPPDLRDAARALGLRPSEALRRIEIPLALRSVLSGIKTAAVINVGTATLGALIGAGGYGQPILTGIRLDDMSLVLEGAIPAAALALLVQGFFDLVERLSVSPGLRSD